MAPTHRLQQTKFVVSFSLFSILIFAFSACGSESVPATPGSDASDASESMCTNETRGLKFTSGLEIKSKNGNYTARWDSIAPNPVTKGPNTWTFTLRDKAGTPATKLTIAASLYMPDHKHGSNVTPTSASNGSGQYVFGGISFMMGGLWETTLSITDHTGPAADSITIPYCIP